MKRRKSERQGVDANSVAVQQRVARDIKCIRAAPERVEAGCDLFGSSVCLVTDAAVISDD
jgi:hypothetical protein